MKTRILVLLAMAGAAQAQVYTPPSGGNTPPANTTPQDSATNPQQQTGPSPFGQEIPMLDPSAETITVGGVTIPLGDNRVLKARFEKYLSQPPENSEDALQYRKDVDKILATISPFRQGGPDLEGAFKLLPSASTYPGDANLCMSLAESVYMALLSKQDVRGLERLNGSLEKEKHSIIREGDWQTRHERDQTLGNRSGTGGNNGGAGNNGNRNATQSGTGANSLRYTETLRRIAEIEALKKANIAKTEAQTLRTKAQYQVTMVQWFMQRRYEHVLMAARFYNQIWKDGDQTLRVNKNSDVSKLFSESVGVNPTVASLDSLSNEAIRETAKYVEAFNLMLSRNELHSASQRLMEAYALGEYLAPVATLELEKKRRVLDYYRDLNELYGAMQARDYVKAVKLSDALKEKAKDYPSSKVDSAIAGYTMASNMAIEEAKAHLYQNEKDKASEKFKQAVELWPTNPKRQEFADLINNLGPMVKIRNDFDRLLAEGNYREIALRQLEIGAVIKDDPQRMEAFNQIVNNLREIETALLGAEKFSHAGQNYAAWEQLAKVREKFPDDPKLGRELELLAPKVADFTLALTKARDFEEREPQQTGTALAWYLKARSIHPGSDMARDGVKRMANEIMPAD